MKRIQARAFTRIVQRQYENKLTVLFYLRGAHTKRGATPDKSLYCSIYCRISVNGIRAVPFSTGIKLFPYQWDSSRQKVVDPPDLAAIHNSRLRHIIRDLEDLNDELSKAGIVSAEDLKQTYLGDKEVHYTFLDVAAQFEEIYKSRVKQTTYQNFMCRFKHLKTFLQAKKLTKILCEQFTRPMAMQFVDWLKAEKKFSQNHCIRSMLVVRQVLTHALHYGLIDKHPLPVFSMKSTPYNPIVYLDADELERLENYEFTQSYLVRARDVFVFQCHTGLAYCDVKNLRRLMHTKIYDGHIWVDMTRQKTNKRFSVPLSDKAKEILRKYGDKLPVISLTNLNLYIKICASIAGINKHLTTHVGRKTAGMLWLNNDVPLETVAVMLGDTESMVKKHYAKILEAKVARDMAKFTDRMKKRGQ